MKNQIRVEGFAIRLVHFNRGWRYWAFERRTGFAVEHGLAADGYATEEEAQRAVAKVERRRAK